MTATPRCVDAGCTGVVLDGYCDVCGTPGPTSAPAVGSTSTAGLSPAAVASAPSARTQSSRASNRLASAAIGSARVTAAGSKITRRTGTSSTRLRTARLGAGLTQVPPQPPVDASTALMVDPQLPEEKRFCPSCNAPVGRSREGQPGRTEGFCSKCRNPFSFTPKLQPGDVVGGQYKVAGCLAFGGLGWIYLAQDSNVSDRWVVLKGLLNSGDADALAAAIAEQRFLAQVEHPLIVEIYNFVTHEGAGYIVMEYVGGTSLKSLLKQRMKDAGHYDALPLDQATAFILEVLPAFQYLHDLGLVYCDFKPDNIIQVGDDVKLIDLGGVRRLDDVDSAIYGTVGYQAPEVAEVGPSVASDVYTIGRTLLVLAMEFRGYQSTYLHSLPPVDQTPLFTRYDSFYRLVAKACAPDPADRFASAAELRGQLLGVLREVVATDRPGQNVRNPTPSVLFLPPAVASEALTWRDLPALAPDTADPMAWWLPTLGVIEPAARLEQLAQAPQASPEVLLDICRTALLTDTPDLLDPAVDRLLSDDPWEWRAVWFQGLKALQSGDGTAARGAFNAVYGQVPGELAPKLALALACEASEEPDVAESLYGICAHSDPSYVAPAAFALARIRGGRGDIDGAVAALDLVPVTSRAYPDARRQRAEQLARSDQGLPALAEALHSLDGVSIDPLQRALLTAQVLTTALAHVREHGRKPEVLVGGYAAREPDLRTGLEAAYRTLASLHRDPVERVRLVDAANAVRRWTLR